MLPAADAAAAAAARRPPPSSAATSAPAPPRLTSHLYVTSLCTDTLEDSIAVSQERGDTGAQLPHRTAGAPAARKRAEPELLLICAAPIYLLAPRLQRLGLEECGRRRQRHALAPRPQLFRLRHGQGRPAGKKNLLREVSTAILSRSSPQVRSSSVSGPVMGSLWATHAGASQRS